VLLPGEALGYLGAYFASQRALANDNAAAKQQLLAQAPAVQGFSLLDQENAQLRALLKMAARFPGAATAAEVLYS